MRGCDSSGWTPVCNEIADTILNYNGGIRKTTRFGASRFQIFYKIVVPISGPVFATVAILTFIASWNMFLWPIMTIQSDELRPVMVGLLFFFQRDTQWPQIMAYSTMIVIPVLAFFFAFQNAFVKSVATSGLKG